MNRAPGHGWQNSLAAALGMSSGRANGTAKLLRLFIIASLPAALIGAISAGSEFLVAAGVAANADGWRQTLLALGGLELSTGGTAAALYAGLLLWLPLLLTAAVTSLAWEVLFASARHRAADPGWALSAWLFVLLLPPQTPLLFAVLGMSFGVVFGHHVFGGTGRYVASPAVIGALFLNFSYPALAPVVSTFGTVASAGIAAAGEQGIHWWPVFAGREVGLLGAPSALAALAGAVFLALRGGASLRTLIGALLGLSLSAQLAVGLGDALPMHWQFALGNAAFCWAFVLTDPTTQPLTRSGRWMYGALFGVLVILIREADPTQPEGTLFAALLAALLVPLIDYITVRAERWRYGPGLQVDV